MADNNERHSDWNRPVPLKEHLDDEVMYGAMKKSAEQGAAYVRALKGREKLPEGLIILPCREE